MKKPGAKYRDAIFIVTEEHSCPIYTVGDELKVERNSMSAPSFKPSCLILAEDLLKIISSRDSFGGFTRMGGQKTRFKCSGCEGVISFEFKKERDFATLQMKLLNEKEERRKRKHLEQFFSILRKLDIFESLDDDALSDLTVLLELKNLPLGKVVLKKGTPTNHLYILLQGSVKMVADDGSTLTEMGPGEIFGEMSLLSGEPIGNSIHSLAPLQVAMLSVKNFRHVLRKYPVLQLFLFKLLVDRAQTTTLRSGTITSGMTGELSEVGIVDLFQLIHSSGKTGTISFGLEKGKGMVFFKDGQVIHARYHKLRNKDAFYGLLNEKTGHFSYVKGIPKELDNLVSIGDFMGILMEGLQRIDEHTG